MNASCPLNKATDWARVTKRRGSAVGNACRTCMSIANTYPSLSFEGVVARCKTNDQFREEVKAAAEVCRKRKAGDFQEENLTTSEDYYVKVERELVFMSLTEFEKHFRIKASEVNQLNIIELPCESGKIERGILLMSPQAPWRRVTVGKLSGSELRGQMLSSSQQLRPQQGRDLQEWYQGEVARTVAQRSLREVAPSETQIQEWIAAAEPRQQQQQQQQQLLEEQGVAALPPLQAGAVEHVADEDDEEVWQADAPAARLLLQGGKDGKKGGKNKGGKGSKSNKGGSKNGGGKGGYDVRSASGRSASGSVRDRSRSGERSVKTRTSPKGKLESQALKYMEVLKPEKIAEGICMGRDVFQASRVAHALEQSNPGAECVSLRAHIDFCRKAELLSPAKIMTLPPSELQQTMEEVLPQLEQHPEELRAGILRCSMRQLGVPTNKEQVDKWLELILPGLAIHELF